MSQLPQRKHTLEELAALRGTDFPLPESVAAPVSSPPPSAAPAADERAVHLEPDHHRYMPPVKHGVHHDFEGLLPEAAHQQQTAPDGLHATLPPVHAVETRTRRTTPEKSGVSHVFDGLRPDAANENAASLEVAPESLAHTALPQRKHDEREIQDMRRRDAFQTRPPVAKIVRQALHPVTAGFFYAIAAAVCYLTVHYWGALSPQKYIAPGAGCGILLMISLLIYLKKPRARHHAAFLCGIALIILGFVILLTIKSPYAP